MSIREIVYYIFYSLCFLLAIFGGFKAPDSHTPPGAFIIELFTLPVGGVIFIIDLIMRKSTKVHKIGLGANSLIMAILLIVYFI